MKKQTLEEFLKYDSGLLCNHTSWNIGTGSYFLDDIPGLKRIFFPEHGLFSEYQDQVPITEENLYKNFGIKLETVSLYGEDESSLFSEPDKLKDLEILFVDLQDVGSRYFTYSVTLGMMMKSIIAHAPDVTMIVIDRENPAGLQIEGTRLPEKYSSFIGWTGLPHRHGLTLAELALFYYKQLDADFSLFIQPLTGQPLRSDFSEILPDNVHLLKSSSHAKGNVRNHVLAQSQFIPPSPNIPGPVTPHIYPGQCLIEGTNLNEGRGTTRPFEQFGAPYLSPIRPLIEDDHFMRFPGAILRPIRFVPTFHKWENKICEGFHIHLSGAPYHSLLHSLYIIRRIKELYPNSFEWRKGMYEFGSDKRAIELLAGDSTLLDYLHEKITIQAIKEYIQYSEYNWLNEMNDFKIYNRKNYSILKHM